MPNRWVWSFSVKMWGVTGWSVVWWWVKGRTRSTCIWSQSHSSRPHSAPAHLYMYTLDVYCLIFPTWDMFSPANVHHQLSVRQVTQRSQGLDVAVWYRRVWHGINLLWLSDQQVRDDFVICKAAKGNWHDHQTRRKTQRQRVGEFLLQMTTKCSTANVGQKKKGSFV